MSAFLSTVSLEEAIAQLVAAAKQSGTPIEHVIEKLRAASSPALKFKSGDEFRPVASKTALSGVIGHLDHTKQCYVVPRLGGSPLRIPFSQQHAFTHVQRCAFKIGDMIFRRDDNLIPPDTYIIKRVYSHDDDMPNIKYHETFRIVSVASIGNCTADFGTLIPFSEQGQWVLAECQSD